ncbi:hypothetical protein Patl1_36422 [Pistacia atlantica]|nr:hypothetical protein Patl1_36422 [Pistacia atlantica]
MVVELPQLGSLISG